MLKNRPVEGMLICYDNVMIKNKTSLSLIGVAILVIILVLALPFINRYQMWVANQDSIEKFNKIELFTPISKEDNRTINGGDGVDSKPYLQVERELTLQATGREVETTLIKNLDMQSIRIVEKKYTQRCNVNEVEAFYKLVDSQGKEITVNTGSKIESLSSGCRYDSITPDIFYDKNVTYMFARTYMY